MDYCTYNSVIVFAGLCVFAFVDLRRERKYLEEELCSPDFLLPTALQECIESNGDMTASEMGRQTSPPLW